MTAAKGLPELDERFATIKGVRIRFYLGGAGGHPVLLVHGLGGAASNWVGLAQLLARTRPVLVPDLPGHGGSSPLPVVPNLEVYADRLAVLVQHVGFRRAAVVGHSLGGLVALRLALRHPEQVNALLLAGSAGFSPSSRRAEQALVLSSLIRPGRWLAPHRSFVARHRRLRRATLGWGASDPEALSAGAVEGFLAGPALHTDTISAARALILDDVGARLGAVRCPSLVLWGARDTLTPIGDAFEYGCQLGAPVRAIPDCGHLLIGERPDACAHAIEQFLDGIREVDELPRNAEALR
ncbi:MAG: alpha/beta fold hydrolase [Actinobacteria bacterium]|nr:alpha/beta fold hydrolase [Actinomycetota bacterium]